MSRIKFVPICDWPFLLNQAEPVIEERMSEVKCKNIFSKWIQSANDSKFLERPKSMQLFFNDDQKLEGIRFIMNNGSSEDFIEFGGNLQYIAPELYLHHEYHADSVDVWSLGITLYRLLVGRYPFNSDSMGDRALFERMLQFRYPIPNALSPEAKSLIQQMLSPVESRISLNRLPNHPWFTLNRRKKKSVRVLKKIIRFIIKGPYPPPKNPYFQLIKVSH
ncbi:kinase-like protein [Rhizopus microsporus var. microsporus]|uniref:Kinase-like protein n=2 Tax=Rhizopus microsporus TaxID=58291 RepID=A0A2G4T2E3_RHIZD|nr:kinase-like protein [Rhizopus microsporus ATCC 52813]ORE09979.1 kinase-like protein [Rhizopus microsporus var. microsporus]PHZ15185.1 kinase-like protein [Rhizopus microsporus ATCC 52813]